MFETSHMSIGDYVHFRAYFYAPNELYFRHYMGYICMMWEFTAFLSIVCVGPINLILKIQRLHVFYMYFHSIYMGFDSINYSHSYMIPSFCFEPKKYALQPKWTFFLHFSYFYINPIFSTETLNLPWKIGKNHQK